MSEKVQKQIDKFEKSRELVKEHDSFKKYEETLDKLKEKKDRPSIQRVRKVMCD